MTAHLDELNEKSLLERENKIKLIIDSYSIIKRHVVSCLKVCDSVVNDKIGNAELSLDDIHKEVLDSTFKVYEKKFDSEKKKSRQHREF